MAAGAAAIGLNFVPTSSRFVDLETARAVLAEVPDRVLGVGIFWDHPLAQVLEIAGALHLDGAQLHGDPTPAHTAGVAAAVDTVIRVVAADRIGSTDLDDRRADIVMVDAPTPGRGVTFDWDLVGDLATTHRVLLAGGLRPDNVGGAIARVRPWGVDVASGVELEPAVKDHAAIARFVTEARAAGAQPPGT